MLNRIVAKGAAIGLLLVFPRTILPAQTPASRPAPAQTGVIYPQSGVTLKGNPVITSTAVYSGDPIQTRELATLLTGDGVSMLLKPHTSLVFGKVVELGCGGLVLVTGKAIAVRFAGIAVVPSGNPGKLEIDNAGGIITVIVRSGTASLNQGGRFRNCKRGGASAGRRASAVRWQSRAERARCRRPRLRPYWAAAICTGLWAGPGRRA